MTDTPNKIKENKEVEELNNSNVESPNKNKGKTLDTNEQNTSEQNKNQDTVDKKKGKEVSKKKENYLNKFTRESPNVKVRSSLDSLNSVTRRSYLHSEISHSSLSSSLDSLNIRGPDFVEPLQLEKDEVLRSVNLAFSKNSKSKALSFTSLETASSSLVGSSNNAALSILHIKNSNSSFSEQASKSFSSNSETKKKSKGKYKDKAEEDPEIEEIRNSANNISILDEVGDDFMGLASSSLINGANNRNYNTVKEGGTKGKNKLKEGKYDTFSSRFNYGKGPSAAIEGPYTVFHSSSSSSSLDFLLESAAVASSSHNNDDGPPLNINFNRNQPNSNNNTNTNNTNRNNDNNDINNSNSSLGNDRFDIERLVETSNSSVLGLRYSQKNLDDLILKPVSLDQSIKCTLIRSKVKNIPSYELYIEHTDSTFSLLLYSRKVKIGNHSEYVITRKTFMTNVPEESEIVGRLKSNFVGTAFVLYDNNKKYVKKDKTEELRGELGAVLYEPNILGFKGPRKMKVITTRLDENGEFIPCKPRHTKETLIERSKDPFDREMLVLYNKAPQWNEETQSFVLNFNHRVRIASVKNFQIVNNDDLDYIIMQFGKKKKNIFTLDFRYPFSALLAFAIALTSLDTKIACE